jgi:hypothetical protein
VSGGDGGAKLFDFQQTEVASFGLSAGVFDVSTPRSSYRLMTVLLILPVSACQGCDALRTAPRYVRQAPYSTSVFFSVLTPDMMAEAYANV